MGLVKTKDTKTKPATYRRPGTFIETCLDHPLDHVLHDALVRLLLGLQQNLLALFRCKIIYLIHLAAIVAAVRLSLCRMRLTGIVLCVRKRRRKLDE